MFDHGSLEWISGDKALVPVRGKPLWPVFAQSFPRHTHLHQSGILWPQPVSYVTVRAETDPRVNALWCYCQLLSLGGRPFLSKNQVWNMDAATVFQWEWMVSSSPFDKKQVLMCLLSCCLMCLFSIYPERILVFVSDCASISLWGSCVGSAESPSPYHS